MNPPRPVHDRDVPGVHALIARCYEEHGLRLVLTDSCEAHILNPGPCFRASGGEFWVITDEHNQVRATSALFIHDTTPPRAELKTMYVDSLWRRRGIGRKLLNHVMSEARRAGCTAIELWSDTRFDAAHRMYESEGFTRTGKRAIEDSNNSEEWGYRRDLESPSS